MINTAAFGQILGISTGKHNSAILTKEKAYVCGRNDENCLNQASQEMIFSELTEFKIDNEKIKQLAFGDQFFTIILTQSRKVFGIGKNQSFQLGLGHNKLTSYPKEIPQLKGKSIQKIVSGEFSAALDEQGLIYAWGIGNLLIPNAISLKEVRIDDMHSQGQNVWFLSENQELYQSKVKELFANERAKVLMKDNVQSFSVGGNFMIALGTHQTGLNSQSSNLHTSSSQALHSLGNFGGPIATSGALQTSGLRSSSH